MPTRIAYIRIPDKLREFYERLAKRKHDNNYSAAIVAALYRDSGIEK